MRYGRGSFEHVERHVRRARGNERAASQLATAPSYQQRERIAEHLLTTNVSWARAAMELLRWGLR